MTAPARLRLTGSRAAHLRRIARIQRRVQPLVRRALGDLGTQMGNVSWVQTVVLHRPPAELHRFIRTRLDQLGADLVRALLLGTLREAAELVEALSPEEVARELVGRLIAGLEDQALRAVQAQIEAIAKAGVTDDALRAIGRLTGLTVQQIQQVARAREAAMAAAQREGLSPLAAANFASRHADRVGQRLLDVRAKRIARTETSELVGHVVHQRAQDLARAGLQVMHEAISARDEDVCHVCRFNDPGWAAGKPMPRPITQPFPSGALRPPFHPGGCRCLEDVTVVDDRGARGDDPVVTQALDRIAGANPGVGVVVRVR